ncbi:hypothetical protein [Amycolatopsis magusensis]|uniref:hypothetical protein n=1 Tax=Amycolatopsis magusensis TaxID=882444 RepID=UPI00378E1BB0
MNKRIGYSIAGLLGAAALAGLAGPAVAATPVAVQVDSTVESYCGPTDTIRDTGRNMSFFMVFTGSTFHQGRWIRHYDAKYLSGALFKYTSNSC